jgi:signal transduction histidine kinase
MCVLAHTSLLAQESQIIKVKTFDQRLHTMKNVEVSLNNHEYFQIGKKGVAIVALNDADLPIKSIKIKDDNLEAASWNLSKGILEIIIRPKSYKVVHFILRVAGDSLPLPLPLTPVSFKGLNSQTVTTNKDGGFDLTLSLSESVTSDQFSVQDVLVKDLSLSDQENILLVERSKIEEPVQKKVISPPKIYFNTAKLDSVKTLTDFYKVFKNIPMGGLDENAKWKIEDKFNHLVLQMEDSVSKLSLIYKSNITDSSTIKEDIQSLTEQASLEGDAFQASREQFDAAIKIITKKLDKGVATLSKDEWNGILSDLELLDKLLTDNEKKFNQAHVDYHNIIVGIKERYFDIKNLETRLSISEKERIEQQEVFQRRLVIMISLFIAFAVLIVLLISFSSRLRNQSSQLKTANEEVKTINENLEEIVMQRTSMLEESYRELDTFLYRASHDLRSPIRSILGLCNISGHIPGEDYISRVKSTTLKMDRMLKKLINISQISQESTSIATISLALAIAEVKNKMAEMIATSGVQFHVDCPADITLETSPMLLENILVNLIENSIFFSVLKNPDHARVEIKAVVNGRSVALSVHDNGVGIPETVRPKLFHMFFVGNEESKGNGLGLY